MDKRLNELTPQQRLFHHVLELERIEALKKLVADQFKEAIQAAKSDGYDAPTLKVVLKLRKMTTEQRRERRALEAIYLASLGMLEGDPLPDEARRRLDRPDSPGPSDANGSVSPGSEGSSDDSVSPASLDSVPSQPPLELRTPDEARQEGADAAAAGRRIYDNPYPAGDPCRAAWDEGWCAQQKSHGMDTPTAYQRRAAKPPDKDEKSGDAGDEHGLDKKGAA